LSRRFPSFEISTIRIPGAVRLSSAQWGETGMSTFGPYTWIEEDWSESFARTHQHRSADLLGKPCIKSTRISVSLILDQLAGGTSVEELLSDYPQLKREDVLAAIAYGAEVSRERIIPVPRA
jgi:uncharacterized protein (DUF433 family)